MLKNDPESVAAYRTLLKQYGKHNPSWGPEASIDNLSDEQVIMYTEQLVEGAIKAAAQLSKSLAQWFAEITPAIVAAARAIRAHVDALERDHEREHGATDEYTDRQERGA